VVSSSLHSWRLKASAIQTRQPSKSLQILADMMTGRNDDDGVFLFQKSFGASAASQVYLVTWQLAGPDHTRLTLYTKLCISRFSNSPKNISFPRNTFRLRNDLYCVGWGVKLYSLTHSSQNQQLMKMEVVIT